MSISSYITKLPRSQSALKSILWAEETQRQLTTSTKQDCSIWLHIQIVLTFHPNRRFVSTYPTFYSKCNNGCPLPFRDNKIFDDDVPKNLIENDVWIGTNAIIPGGIQIGTGAIVADGSVAVKDVLPYAIVGGNPAKIMKYRFPDIQIKFLLSSEWWTWPKEKIFQHLAHFSDVEKFVEAIGQ